MLQSEMLDQPTPITAVTEAEVTRPPMFSALDKLIGKTPLISVTLKDKGVVRTLYAKLEYFNLSGSIKDRMALGMLRRAYQSGAIRSGDMIAEATSGNSGIAFCAVGRALGHPVRIYMPDWMSTERIALMKSYGAEVVLVSQEQGGFLGCMQMTEDLARTRDNVFLPRQFSNPDNGSAQSKGTGSEILAQLGHCPDRFVAGVGTGGTVMGVGKALCKACPSTKIHPMEPAESPTLSTGFKVGTHRIQGVSDEFIPDILCLETLDEIVCVNDGDGIIMAQKLSAELGLGVGISSGANLIAALKLARQHPADEIVTIFCDDNKKYLTTDLTKIEPVKPGYLSTDVELLEYAVIIA